MQQSSAMPNLIYHPRGTCRALMESRATECLISGPAGTGKSLACLWKLHFVASMIPNIRALMARKTRASLTESALVTFERYVLPPNHPALKGAHRPWRQAYRYPNGSEIIVCGMDKASRIMSTEFDLVYCQEAIELDEEEWEAITTRLRNGVLSYQQLLADTNPERPRHWLKQRCDAGKTTMLESRHEDNPVLWDGHKWTPAGVAYLAKLDALTGPRKLRLRWGRWVQAEGVVYEGWDPAVHLVPRFEIPSEWTRILSIDFGFTNPFVAQWWAIDPDGRLYRYREIYHTRRLVEDHAQQIRKLSAEEPWPVCAVVDHDAEDRATLERHLGIPTVAAIKSKSPGFQAVAARLVKAGDGKPRLFLLRDSLVERDNELHEAKRPTCTEEEFDGYIWRNKGIKEEPVKENDHGMDALRYMVYSLDSGQVSEQEEEELTVFRT